MTSFEIADCPTRLSMAETSQGADRIQKGTLTLTVRNNSARSRAGRVAIETQGTAKPDWFSIEGALPTSPREVEREFQAKASETIRVTIQVSDAGPAGSHLFRVRATAEDDPDDDFTVGPNVAFEVAAAAAPQPKPQFPWWAGAIAAALVLLLVGGMAYVVFVPVGPKVPQIIGMPLDQATAMLQPLGIESDAPVHVISPTLPPSRFANHVLAIEPNECESIRPNEKLRVYVGAPNDPFHCGACNNRNLESLGSDIQERIRAGARLTVSRYSGIIGPRPLRPCPD
jgi:hypothetical protein